MRTSASKLAIGTADDPRYDVGVAEITMVGDDPLVDGMSISVRMRRDFTVTNAARFLAAARRAYRELHPDADANEANTMVMCAADAVFTVLEHAGLLGHTVEDRLARGVPDGLALGGRRAQFTVNEPDPLPPGYDCFRTGDVFALPTTDVDEG